MKNYYLFLLLIICIPALGQNSYNRFPDDLVQNQRQTPIEFLLYAESLFLVDLDATKDASWLISDQHAEQPDNLRFDSMTLASQLHKLNENTPLEVVHNATIERFIRVYLKNRREYFSKLIGKSKYYFPLFEQVLDKHDLPLEIKYLAVVESALSPTAVSKSGAKGLWQFMYGTATDYNLYIDSFVDERFDLVRSTESAVEYLKDLYKQFDNWDLALAAYNSGPQNVLKAIQRADGSTNFWDIRKFLPQETRSYVPAFYATMYLFNYAHFHELKAQKSEVFYVQTDTIQLQNKVSLKIVHESLNMDYEILKSLNPQYHKDLVPMNHRHTPTLRLPKNLITRFIEKESNIYNKSNKILQPQKSKRIPIRSNNSYLVQEGDNLHSIASKFGISLSQLKTWNGLETNFLIAQQRLVVTDRKVLSTEEAETSNSGHRFSGN